MKIAMLSVHTSPLATLGGKKTGGMNVYIRGLVRELGRRGVEVDVYTRAQDADGPQVRHDLGPNTRVIYVPAGPERALSSPAHVPWLGEFVNGVRLSAALLGADYDLIHSHYWLSGIVARELQAFWDVPVVHMFHTLALMKNRIAQTSAEREGSLRLDAERSIVDWADRIIAATPAEQAQLKWLMRARTDHVEVIPPGVDLERFRPMDKSEARCAIGVPPTDNMLLFVGRPEPLKGGATLLKAIRLLRDRNAMPPNTCLSIIGGDPKTDPTAELDYLIALREELGLQDVVFFLGKRDQDSLRYYYNAATAVVMPSHYESFGMVALEAMASGTPVVASEVGGLAFLVQDGETGFHVPDRDPEALCNALDRLLNDAPLRERLGQQAAAHAEQYAWPHIAARLLRVYDAVVAEPRPSSTAMPRLAGFELA